VGKLDGKVKKYVDGKLAMEATYVAGKVEGPYAEFRAGKPAVTGQFVDDRKDGAWTIYAADGTVMRTSPGARSSSTSVRKVFAAPRASCASNQLISWRVSRSGGTEKASCHGLLPVATASRPPFWQAFGVETPRRFCVPAFRLWPRHGR